MLPDTPPRSPKQHTEGSLGAVVSSVYVVRHGEREDHVDPYWHLLADTPYDPPLSDQGRIQAKRTGAHLAHTLHERSCPRVDRATHFPSPPPQSHPTTTVDTITPILWDIHASPFLRCVQTAQILAASLHEASGSTPHLIPPIRLHPGLAEWHRESWFEVPVPEGMELKRHKEAAQQGWWPLELENQDHGSISPPSRIGRWGESSQEMAQRIGDTFESILQWQQDHLPRDQSAFSSPSPSSSTSYQIKTIIVTHACGVQALVGRADGISPSGWGSTIMPDNCSLTLLESEGRDESEGREMWRVVKRARTSHLMG
ncbi:MAG: histidine phosphatase superfamily [Piptocephalis tieghemiana]|nr:MAG: histidine phosphatase superfamily [Piptocephalis tieghemiana]